MMGMMRPLACPLLVLLTLLPPARVQAAPVRPSFDPAWLRPYLQNSGKPSPARDALLAGRWADAVKALRLHLRRPDAPHRQQARFLLARALAGAGRHAEAARLWGELERSYPLLVNYHRFYGARALYRAGRPAEAATRAARVDQGSALALEATLVQADALRAAQKLDKTIPLWQRYLAAQPRGARAPEAHYRIGEALQAQARQAADGPQKQRLQRSALGHFKQVKLLAPGPLSPFSGPAAHRIKLLVSALPDGRRLAALSPAEQLRQALALFRAMRNKQAEQALSGLLRRQDLSARQRCRASYLLGMSVFRQRQRPRAEPLFSAAEQACRKARHEDLIVKSLYSGARCLVSKGDFKGATKRYGKLEREFPHHSYADDARLRSAEAYAEWNKPKKATAALAALVRSYPDGDMVREARWRLARDAYLGKRFRVALRHLDNIITRHGRAPKYYAHGRALYWKARILDRQGKGGPARREYQRCIRQYPLSYYALLSFNRLREKHHAAFVELERELVSAAGKSAGRWSFRPRRLYARPGFARGVELARLGFGEQAARELARVGLRVSRDTDRQLLWLAAVLFDSAGLWYRSHQVPRRLDTSYRWSYPLGPNHRRWTISYPRAFRRLVQHNAKQAGVPWPLVLAVMREESGFRPDIESWANAVGLMQLLVRTARSRAGTQADEVNRKRLQDPALNIRLGASYLGFLRKGFKGVLPLAVAGYNAGEGAVFRWLKKRSRIPLDEFMELIPYDQTRRYTKRVLSSLLTYAVLYLPKKRRIPRIGQKLPKVKIEDLRRSR
jgi:soluble lytic murein transglycosylase